jgi:hypothetical protein
MSQWEARLEAIIRGDVARPHIRGRTSARADVQISENGRS